MTDTRGFAFGGYTLDQVRRLLFDARGETVPLNSRAFDTLLYFLENPGGLLTKQTLLKAIWPNSIVEENNLSQSILAVRRALGESPGENRYIVTVPGRGFRFVATVRRLEAQASATAFVSVMRQSGFATTTGIALDDAQPAESAQSGPVPRAHFGPRLWWLTRLLAPVLCVATLLYAQFADQLASGPGALPVSVAVLPFVDMSTDHAQQFLADALASELLVRLAGEPGLKVVSRTASFAAATRAQDLRSIGRVLNADRLLEGSIRAAGKRLRVSVQIIDARSGSDLWLKVYDRNLGDSTALHDELARTIATDVAAELGAPPPYRTGVSSP